MRAANRFSMLTLGLALVLGLSSAAISLADDAPAAPATGTISGKVLDAAGNPAKGVHVSAYPAPAADAAKPAKGTKRERPAAVATADTGDDGTFKLTAVPVGSVLVMAKLDADAGRVKGNVTVTAGADTKVDDIKLAPAPVHAKKNAK